MKHLFILAVLVALLVSCAHRDCRHVAVDSYNRAVAQGHDARIVFGKMWSGTHAKAWEKYHAETQVLVDGKWCYIDNSTGVPLTGWYGSMLEPPMTILRVYQSAEGFRAYEMTD